MTLASQLEAQTKSQHSRKGLRQKTSKKDDDKKESVKKTSDKGTSKKDSSKDTSTSKTANKPVVETAEPPLLVRKSSFIRRKLSKLIENTPLRRSVSLQKDLHKASTCRHPWNASLTSLREEAPPQDEADGAVLYRDDAFMQPSRPVTRTQSLLVGLHSQVPGGRRRVTSHGGPPSPGSSVCFDQDLDLDVFQAAGSLPQLNLLAREHEAATKYRRNLSLEEKKLRAGGTTKLRRQKAFKNELPSSGRSRSLTHLDSLHGAAPLRNDMDSRSEPDTSPGRLAVPPVEPSARRRHKLARSQVSSSEYFSVSFECGDEPWPEEFLPASKGTSLGDALRNVCTRRGIELLNINIFVDTSKTPLPLSTTDTSWLGGKHLRIKAKDDKSRPGSKNSAQVSLRKTTGSYRAKSGRFFSASTEDPNYIGDSSHEGSFKSSKGSKQRWSGLFGNSKDTKMELLAEHLNNYDKHGIPKLPVTLYGQDDEVKDEELFTLEPDWRDVVTNSTTLGERLQQQQTAVWELVHTEAAYIRTLQVVTDLFLACLHGLQAANILNEVDTGRLFSNITDIYRANRHFWTQHVLPMLTASRSSGRPLDPSLLLDGFVKFEEIFYPYSKYCTEQSHCQQYCREKHQENELFTAYLVWCETQKDCNRLRLMDIVVKPMQRLTKYSLLLKAILKHTDLEEQRFSLDIMIRCVDEFVNSVNTTLKQKQDHERLRGIIAKIESYDVVESKDDDLDRLLKQYSELDLTCAMPGCHGSRKRHLLLESDLKLKDTGTSKMDVHCFLFTDMLLVCKPTTRRSDGRVKVVRQPYIVERLVVSELSRDPPTIAIVYLNEYRTACAAFTLSSTDAQLIKSWADSIRKAQDLYLAAKGALPAPAVSRQPSGYCEEELLEDGDMSFTSVGPGLAPSRSPRGGSSRGSRVSSLAHSHSGSMDMNEVSSLSSVSQSRGVSVENELRGSSLSSDEGVPPLGPSPVDSRHPPTPSPRAERRSPLSKTPNTLSVQVPVFSGLGQSLPNLTLAAAPPSSLLLAPPSTRSAHHLLSPGQRGVSYPPPSPPLRRAPALPQSRNPPLRKTRHVGSTATLSPTHGNMPIDFDVPVIAGVSPPSEEATSPDPADFNRSHRHPIMKRLARSDNRRYHTAGAIDDIKKQDSRDSSIHKRLSWNCGMQQQVDPRQVGRGVSCDSMQSSSGVSSTGSQGYGEDLRVVCEDPSTGWDDFPLSPSMEAINSELTQRRPQPPTIDTNQPSEQAELLRMKDLILTDSSIQASNV